MVDFSLNGENTAILKKIIDVTALYISGPRVFTITPEGLQMATMESSSSVFFCFTLDKVFFERSPSGNLQIGLNIDDLKKVLSSNISKKAEVNFSYDEKNNRFNIQIKNGSKTNEYKINVHAIDNEEKDVQKQVEAIPLDASIVFVPGELKNILADLAVVADKEFKQLKINIPSEQEIKFELKSGTVGIDATSTYPVENGGLIQQVNLGKDDNDEDIPVCSYYDMEYLQHLTKIENVFLTVQMELDNEHPLRIRFDTELGVHVLFLMAPLEDEDDIPVPKPVPKADVVHDKPSPEIVEEE